MIQQPLVSILLPVYNNEAFLRSCIESLESQTYRNLEVIAIDDASKDSSYAILKDVRKRDKRFRVYRNIKRYGLATTLNRLIRRAKGAYIALMSPNDLCAKDRINKQVSFLLLQPKVAGVGVQCRFVDKNNRQLGKSKFPYPSKEIRETILAGLSLQPETLMLNRKLLPIDILRFKTHPYPLIYTEVLLKCTQYADFANLPNLLHTHRKTSYTSPARLETMLSLIHVWFRSMASYTRPSLRSLFFPLVRT